MAHHDRPEEEAFESLRVKETMTTQESPSQYFFHQHRHQR